jgi:hypothetical protein
MTTVRTMTPTMTPTTTTAFKSFRCTDKSGSDFQQIQIWNDRSQKQKKNYGRQVRYIFALPV